MLFFNFLFFSNNIRSFWYNIKVLLCFAALGTDFFQTHQTEKQSSAFEGHRYLDPLITMAMVAASFLLDCLLTITAVVGFLFNVYTLVSVLLTKQVIFFTLSTDLGSLTECPCMRQTEKKVHILDFGVTWGV